jgi:hypothetical protein
MGSGDILAGPAPDRLEAGAVACRVPQALRPDSGGQTKYGGKRQWAVQRRVSR